MFCANCGSNSPDGGGFCSNCGQALSAAPIAAPAQFAAPMPQSVSGQTDGKAIASLILGILSLTILSIMAGIPAVILGHVSRSGIRKSAGRLKGEGIALAGLIMGYLSLLVLPVILIIAIAIPNFLRSPILADESTAAASVRTIDTAAEVYARTGKGYPSSLALMGRSTADGAGLLDDGLANGEKSGYRFHYEARASKEGGVNDEYFVVASPITPNTSGRRSFCSDQTEVLRWVQEGQCLPGSPPLQ